MYPWFRVHITQNADAFIQNVPILQEWYCLQVYISSQPADETECKCVHLESLWWSWKLVGIFQCNLKDSLDSGHITLIARPLLNSYD